MEASSILSGIYQILNLINGHSYIGQAYDFGRRKRQHFNALRKGKHGNIYLQRAFKKYGEAAFKFIVIDLVKNLETLTFWEQVYFNLLCPEYNSNLFASRPPGFPKGKTWREIYGPERAAKLRENDSKTHRGERNSNYGDHRTYVERFGEERAAEIIVKISDAALECGMSGKQNPFWGSHHSEKTKRRMNKSHLGKCPSEAARRKMSEARKAYWCRIRAAKNQNTEGEEK